MRTSKQIKQFILDNLSSHQKDIIKATIRKFGLSRQAILKHMNALIVEERVVAYGKTRDRYYELKPIINFSKSIDIKQTFEPKIILRSQVLPNLINLPKNINEICEFALVALFYNILHHANATRLNFKIYISQHDVHLVVSDNGIGIFSNIANAFNFELIRIAVVEIAKGDITSDPEHHSGDDLNAVIQMFDKVDISSSGISLSYDNATNDWKAQESKQIIGTRIHLEIKTNSRRTCQDVFKQLFTKKKNMAQVPVKLARSNGEQLNTREQAQNLLHNLKELKKIEFDFKNIEVVGPAFADELVRKTKMKNQNIDISWINSSDLVDVLMSRAVNRTI